MCKRFAKREGYPASMRVSRTKASGLIAILFPTMPKYELRVPKGLRRLGSRLLGDVWYRQVKGSFSTV